MTQEELFDIYDDNGVHIGVKPRSAVHRDGDWHRVFHCWIIHPDGYVLVQHRNHTKDVFPNKLDITVGGHYSAGESMRDGVREIQEEVGVTVAFEDLIHVGLRVSAVRDSGAIDRQLSDEFFYVSDRDLTAYNLQLSEVSGLIAFPIEAGLSFVKGECETLVAEGVWFDANGVVQRETRAITRDMLIPTLDYYFERVLVLARRCLKGETDLYI
jgi:isopentenyldiphosphate isomerase